MVSLASIRASNAAVTHRTRPLAVFVGGTSGIGEGMARTFGRHTNGNADIIIVGRNKAAADTILSSLPTPDPASGSPPVTREFIQCDATLMKNVNAATQDILFKYPKINYLVVSTGIMTLAGRDKTVEGIDKKLAVHYYARWKFIHDLLPLVSKAKSEDETGSVMSVMAASGGGAIDLNDLGLKKTYSLQNAALAAPTYNDLMMESFSERYPSLALIHSIPGIVRSGLAANSPSAVFRWSNFLLNTLFRPFSVSPEECAEYMWHGIYATASKPGAWRTDTHGGDLGKKRYYGDEEQRTKLWEHTSEEISAALKQAP
ncbi:hypothetical protein CPB83DRAFT_849152 [Crepidotus variabilis]|uniref:NAD(P)-binding protein n=1 Tax=Crepidotus variabilis TaxID=179855 RepID=A0A9P6EMH2_9AGAR|nr:hypothetical protein CPB83DRAFT_849152 [Crepidotus variabilis]